MTPAINIRRSHWRIAVARGNNKYLVNVTGFEMIEVLELKEI